MYSVYYQTSFKKDYKRCKKRGYNLMLLKTATTTLAAQGSLPPLYKAHKLLGNYTGYWECHLKPDWLLIWLQDDERKDLIFIRTDTHSDLF